MKANEPAYPMCNELGHLYAEGLTKREKLAMEIYVKSMDVDVGTENDWAIIAIESLRAADIFFEQLNK